MNKIEQIKADRDGLDIGVDLRRFAHVGVEAIDEADLERLKWWGVFFRRHTPGYFMMRIRIPNGMATAAQCRTIGAIANRWGRGVADISTRQQMQLRWLRINDVPEILDRLRAVDLVTLQTGMDNIRNVVGCSAAGLTPNELLDASPLARALTAGFVGDRAFTNLPRKFNITITGCRENCTHAETQDLALVPSTKCIRGETVAGFNVLVGGKNGSGGYRMATPLDVFVRPEDAAELCLAVVLLFRDHGAREARNKVRLSLVDEENVPCDALAPILESFIRYMEPDKLKRQLPRASAEPPAPSGESVISLDQVPDGASRAVTAAGTTVAVFRRGERLYALHNHCPHAGGALADGQMEGDEVICPVHGYRFNLATGACSTDPGLKARTCALTPRAGGFVMTP